MTDLYMTPLKDLLVAVKEDLALLRPLAEKSLNLQHKQDTDVLTRIESNIVHQIGQICTQDKTWTVHDYNLALSHYTSIHNRMERPVPYTLEQKSFAGSSHAVLNSIQVSARILNITFAEHLIPREIHESFEKNLKAQAQKTAVELNERDFSVHIQEWKHTLKQDLVMVLKVESSLSDEDIRIRLMPIVEDSLRYAATTCQKSFTNPWIEAEDQLVKAFRSMA